MNQPVVQLEAPEVDMGLELPLTSNLRLWTTKTVLYMFLFSVMLGVIPGVMMFGGNLGSTPSHIVPMALGVALGLAAVRTLRTRVITTVDRDGVHVLARRFLTTTTAYAPLEEYSGIRGFQLPLSDAAGRPLGRSLHQLKLEHSTEPLKTIVLYSGTDFAAWQARAAQYPSLLRRKMLSELDGNEAPQEKAS